MKERNTLPEIPLFEQLKSALMVEARVSLVVSLPPSDELQVGDSPRRCLRSEMKSPYGTLHDCKLAKKACFVRVERHVYALIRLVLLFIASAEQQIDL